MKAVVCSNFGPIDRLRVMQADPPQLHRGGVRIRVYACGVNFPDKLIVEGKYQHKPALPFFPGGEVSGRVVEIAPDVQHIRVGQRVMATIYWGGMAEEVVAPADAAIPLPDSMGYIAASVFQGGHLTAYHALKQRGRLAPGEVLLVLGAAGGVGSAAVQLGKAMGATVIAAAGSQQKCNFAAANGADHVINYSREDLRPAVNSLTDGCGADVIFDPVGGELFDQAMRCVAWNGRLLIVGFASGTIPNYAVNLALLKGCAVVGVNYMGFSQNEKQLARQNIDELMQLALGSNIAPRIDRVYSLEEAADAIRYIAARRAIGKVAVRVRGH